MSNNGHYMINIYKDKFLQKSIQVSQENFKKIHTALNELVMKEEHFIFGFDTDGDDSILEMDRSVANKVFGYMKQTADQQSIEDENGVIAQVSNLVQQPTADPVEHPTHYTSHPSGIECIEITRHYCFAIGNAIKYLWRAGLKQDADKTSKQKEIEDLRKAIWYINDRIKQLESE